MITPPPVTKPYGTPIALPTPSRPGYTFAGWYNNAAFTGARLADGYVVPGMVTLHAKWTWNGTFSLYCSDGVCTMVMTRSQTNRTVVDSDAWLSREADLCYPELVPFSDPEVDFRTMSTCAGTVLLYNWDALKVNDVGHKARLAGKCLSVQFSSNLRFESLNPDTATERQFFGAYYQSYSNPTQVNCTG